MKIAAQQLETHLKKTLAPIYLISSDELLLSQEVTTLIHSIAKTKGFSERIFITADGTDWENQFRAHANDFSLFSTQRIIELYFPNKFNQKLTVALQKYIENPAADILLIVRTPKLDSKTESAKWFQAIEKNTVLIPIWPIASEQLPGWIAQRAKKAGLTLTQRAAQLLTEKVEGNLLAAAQEIEKLGLLEIKEPIDENILADLLTDYSHFDLFDLVECALKGNHKRTLRIIDSLKGDDTEPMLILWAFSRELRMLADMLQQKNKGVALPAIFKQFRIWEKRQAGIQQFLRNQTLEQCWDMLTHAANIDRMIKGASAGNVWTELTALALRVGGLSSLPNS